MNDFRSRDSRLAMLPACLSTGKQVFMAPKAAFFRRFWNNHTSENIKAMMLMMHRSIIASSFDSFFESYSLVLPV
jgi:hypothetical protein